MRKIALLIFAVLMFGYLAAGAIELTSGQFELEIEALKVSGTDYIESPEFNMQDDEITMDDANKNIYEYSYKSPKKAFLYSLIIPGWGQKYAESSLLKSLLFLGIEAGSWAGYFKYHGDGNDKTDAFKVFADAHWFEGDTTGADYTDPENPIYSNLDPDTYRGYLLETYNTVDEDVVSESYDGYTERLPSSKTQQYYEMIGKYDQFIGGWDDWDRISEDLLTPHRQTYLNMREDANNLLDKANNLLLVTMLNHLVSAFDAAISANRHNKKIADDTWSIKSELKQYAVNEQIPMITITKKF